MSDNQVRPGPKSSRRAFLLLLPFSVVAGMFTSIAVAAFRFLKPVDTAKTNQWTDVAAIADIHGTQPVQKKISIQHVAGWASSREEHHVYVLPARDNQVLSAVCPHEGCEVSWQSDANAFSCPCHESYFSQDGSRIKGPAGRGLDPLPSRVQDGKIQVQYVFFDNNT